MAIYSKRDMPQPLLVDGDVFIGENVSRGRAVRLRENAEITIFVQEEERGNTPVAGRRRK